MYRIVLYSFLLLFFVACDNKSNYNLLYPVQASKQQLLRYDGYRFLSSELDSPASVMILSNPIKDGSFVDIAFALSNHSDHNIVMNAKNILVMLSKQGHLEILTHEEYIQAESYDIIEALEKLTPKMKEYGCANEDTKENISLESFTPSQYWVWNRHLSYPFKDPSIYLQESVIAAGETDGFIFRVNLPHLKRGQDNVTLFLKIRADETYRFKFVLQSL